VADDAAKRRRDADGAALVAAKGDVDLASGHGCGGARGRAAGHVLVVVGVEGPAVVPDAPAGAEAATQAVHDVLADDGAPRLQHPGDHGGVEVGDEAFQGEGADAHGHAGHRDMVLETDGLAGQQAVGRPLDPALPHPGVERVVCGPRPVPGCPGGRDHRRRGLLQPRLHEGVERLQLFQEVLPVQDGLLGTQVEPQGLGHRHHVIDVRDWVHRRFSSRGRVVTERRRTIDTSLL
jgi:hypothetical protein